jgi:tetratricopeptide (TPR) repeat protein
MSRPGFKLLMTLSVMVLVVLSLRVVMTVQDFGVDHHCRDAAPSTPAPLQDLKNAAELLKLGDRAFDAGNCNEAIGVYTQALALNPDYAEAYNNRAYTYMRMQNYAPALKDLDQALRIRPDYLHALMNRGDIYNYYYAHDRRKAIEDYDHILRLGGQAEERSVCGHRAVAIFQLPGHEGWNVKSWFKLVLSREDVCKMKAA